MVYKPPFLRVFALIGFLEMKQSRLEIF